LLVSRWQEQWPPAAGGGSGNDDQRLAVVGVVDEDAGTSIAIRPARRNPPL